MAYNETGKKSGWEAINFVLDSKTHTCLVQDLGT